MDNIQDWLSSKALAEVKAIHQSLFEILSAGQASYTERDVRMYLAISNYLAELANENKVEGGQLVCASFFRWYLMVRAR